MDGLNKAPQSAKSLKNGADRYTIMQNDLLIELGITQVDQGLLQKLVKSLRELLHGPK